MRDNAIRDSYDQVPYPDLCYTQTHPDRLATLATLLGRSPAPVTACHVLELGCASGGNLIPMAYTLPQSRFVGVDFSSRQIAAGQAAVSALGLDNITLRRQDIMDLGSELGEFDYIIAHGVYSWVPAPVRERLLAICRRHLAPNGVAYVSYNTYPGWHMLGALRQMMRYHTREITDPRARVDQARALLTFLAESAAANDPHATFGEAYRMMLQTYHEFVTKEREAARRGSEALLHDELALINEPVLFHEFVAHAARHGLAYLVEAEFARVMVGNLPAAAQQGLQQMATDTIALEQYMDFLRNRTFRQTLLVADDRPVNRTIQGDLSGFLVSTYAQIDVESVEVNGRQALRLQAPDGAALTTDHPVSQAALRHLAEVAPTTVPFPALLAAARRQLAGAAGETAAADARALAGNLLRAFSYSGQLVTLHVTPRPFALIAGPKPVASALARYQVSQGSQRVSNLRHERVSLDPISWHLLPLLDGRHDREALQQAVLARVSAGDLKLRQEKQLPTELAERQQLLAREVAWSLQWLGRAALLHA